jgi:hypothetical protein
LNEDIKDAMVQWFQHLPRQFFVEEQINWSLDWMPTSMPMGTIFNGIYSFTQNNSKPGFI